MREEQESERQRKVNNDRKLRTELNFSFKSVEVALDDADKIISEIQMNAEQNKYRSVYRELESEKNKMDMLCNAIKKEI